MVRLVLVVVYQLGHTAMQAIVHVDVQRISLLALDSELELIAMLLEMVEMENAGVPQLHLPVPD